MPKLGSNNPFPSVLLAEQASGPATPATGQQRLYTKTDGLLYRKDDAGNEVLVEAASGTLTTKGDILTRDSTSLARVPVGTNNHVLTADSSDAEGIVWAALPVEIGMACSDETTAISTTGTKATFRMPHAMTVTAVRASLTTATTTGLVTVDINEGGVSILSTKITIDATEKTSTTAATPPVISDSALADDAEITIDVDGVGDSTATGLKVWIIGTRA